MVASPSQLAPSRSKPLKSSLERHDAGGKGRAKQIQKSDAAINANRTRPRDISRAPDHDGEDHEGGRAMRILARTLGWADFGHGCRRHFSGRCATNAAASPVSPRPALYVALYERGPAWDTNKAVLEQPGINEHMKFLQANVSVLLAAAPFQQGLPQGSADRTVGMVIVMAATAGRGRAADRERPGARRAN